MLFLKQIKIKSKYHRIGTYRINKISIGCFNEKINILNNEIDA